MIFQSKMGGSPTGDAVPAAQTKMMTYLMPVIMTVLLNTMPSGLVLYWLVNNVATIIVSNNCAEGARRRGDDEARRAMKGRNLHGHIRTR